MRKPPKRVRLGHRLITVETRSRTIDPYLDDAVGYTRYEADLIVIRDDLSNGLARTTVLHELLHVIVESARPGAVKPSKDEAEHWFIGIVENPLLNVLQANPELLAYLMCDD